MDIEFDSDKDAANLAKHGISLRAAILLLSKDHGIELDRRFEYGEERWKAYGEIGGSLCICAYTLRGDTYRVISLRKATRREINAYREGDIG